MRKAREELEEILRIIATVEEPGTGGGEERKEDISEPGLMDALERRLDAAEKKYQARIRQ